MMKLRFFLESPTIFLSYYHYAVEVQKRHPIQWSLREMYWDLFPSRFDAWYDKHNKETD